MPDVPPTVDPKGGLARYWNQPVGVLATVDEGAFEPAAAERHYLYSLLTFALIHAYFNGNKNGLEGEYPWREEQRRCNGSYEGETYLGHNIACVAVDENGEVVDFDFNHNELFNSSVEHAEARLIKRIFSLNQIYDNWELWGPAAKPVGYNTTLSGMTVYTSLESCAQCSGVMMLANALRVVYLQTDPGQYRVGNMLYNLTRPAATALKVAAESEVRPTPPDKYAAPEPIDGARFGFAYKEVLDKAYKAYAAAVNDARPFHISPKGEKNKSKSLTTFLCTDAARAVFAAAATELDMFDPAYGDHRPPRSDGKTAGVKSNAEVLTHIKGFLAHATTMARRGTPHR